MAYFTFTKTIKGSTYPIAHVLKMKTGYKLTDSYGRSYGWFKSFEDILKYYQE